MVYGLLKYQEDDYIVYLFDNKDDMNEYRSLLEIGSMCEWKSISAKTARSLLNKDTPYKRLLYIRREIPDDYIYGLEADNAVFVEYDHDFVK